MTYAYYPGCSLETTAKGYDMSMRAVCEHLGVELVDIPDWNCCGAVPAASVDPALSATLSARILRQTRDAGADVIVAPCSGCYKYIRRSRESLLDDPGLATQVMHLLGVDQLGPFPTIEHPLETLTRELDAVVQSVQRPLKGLRVACYYGCLISRPRGGFDDPEDPMSMDHLMQAVGAQTVPYRYKTRCCGGAVLMPSPDLAFDMTDVVLQKALDQGANCLVLACPLCALLLDTYQGHIGRHSGKRYDLPVLYFTQLMGMAMGIDEKRLGLRYNVTEPFTLLKRVGLKE